ncbi:MAG: diacylglycerol kinase family protein [Patescibacteria group bacterium]
MNLQGLNHRGTSFKNAVNGLKWAFSTQPNLTLHTIAAASVVALGIWVKVGWVEWVALLLTIALVLTAELLNTAVEFTTDALKVHKKTEEEDRFIMLAKDIAAAAVLVAALFSVIIGIVVFLPYFFPQF